jgi:putative protease
VRHKDRDFQNYLTGVSTHGRGQYCGDIVGWHDGMAEIRVKNRFRVGDRLEIVHPAGNRVIELNSMCNAAGEVIDTAHGSGHIVFIPLPAGLDDGLVARLLGAESC